MALYCAACVVGITWGLPSRRFDPFLFPDGDVWPGERIQRLAGGEAKFAATLGADVDPDAIAREGREPVLLNPTEQHVAKILLRYRLYTYQPDEMITMMSLAGMKPGELKFDPRLYQYGGLFIYPVGGLLKLCDVLGLIEVRGDLAYYLDHPDEFGKFYVVARGYAAAWGFIGLFVVFGIARRLAADPPGSRLDKGGGEEEAEPPQFPCGAADLRLSRRGRPGDTAGLLAAALFAFLPVVVCMSHEGKPHLPGAVLMLAAVYFGTRAVERPRGGAIEGGKELRIRNYELPADQRSAREEATGADDIVTSYELQVTSEAYRTQSTIDDRQSTISVTKSTRDLGIGGSRHPGIQSEEGSGDQGFGGGFFWLMCICCGAALGMVLSSAPIFVLIPLVAWMKRKDADATEGQKTQQAPSGNSVGTLTPSPLIAAATLRPDRVRGSQPSDLLAFWRRTVFGAGIGFLVYLMTNPYIVINLFANREVLRSNFGNSLAMYEVARVVEGFARVLELTVEGATLPVLVFGILALLIAAVRRNRSAMVLAVPALVFLLQFVLIGAGKPGEYGRFGIFTNTALAIGTACLLGSAWSQRRTVARAGAIAVLLAWVAVGGAAYLRNFWLDTTDRGSRMVVARRLAEKLNEPESTATITLFAEPAPYSCPPLNFAKAPVMLLSKEKRRDFGDVLGMQVFVDAVDELSEEPPGADLSSSWLSWLPNQTPISWANKPFIVEVVAAQ